MEQSLAKGDSIVRDLKEDMDPEKYDDVISKIDKLRNFVINTDEVIDIDTDDIVGTTKGIDLRSFKPNIA